MSISPETRAHVRVRANFACEYCGVSERDTGGDLTVDHYQPRTAGGSDDAENLVYACHRCNLYKSDYWAIDENAPRIWNPRSSPPDEHFWLSNNGRIYALTETAVFTIRRLRLNRVPLQTHRRRTLEQTAERAMFEQTRQVVEMLARTGEQQHRLLEEQQQLL
ncbi:MAG: HNH endonuclease [Pyrinomonadaceae bacterium MAG19_C2-C3]|nr:HNH endonuclease [Pyrinomonadaceae bacterium MAG19_C2-C3]